MKSLAQIITVFVTLNLITAGAVLAQPNPAPAQPEQPQVEATENAVQETQEQTKAAQKQMEKSQEKALTAQTKALNAQEKTLSTLKKNLSDIRINLGTWLPQSDAQSVLVIPTSEMKPDELTTIAEDMTVMARIINKQLGQEQSGQPWMNYRIPYGDFNFMGHSSRAEILYLQGYGALFLQKVDFPLSPPPQVKEEEKQVPREDIDPVWEQTRRDIYEPQEDRETQEPSEVKYDAEKVENLKTNLIKSLKHAANIRSLKPDETVVITVAGSGYSSKARKIVSHVVVQNHDRRSTGTVLPSLSNDSVISSTATLIIRAKRADINAFAKGDLDLDKFRQRVQMFIQ